MTSLVWIFWKYGGGLMNPAVTLAFALTIKITFHKGEAFSYRFALVSTRCGKTNIPTQKLRFLTNA